ncbi:peptidylprolyl isomerase [Dongia deserti]|uniref:peptidylprolyl isomerase n=1 Tax=Dongia deserti TaxID=2268030 RepID=UPI000E6593F4|nr:peptidylprolyl isomerase [Dongia deserti]
MPKPTLRAALIAGAAIAAILAGSIPLIAPRMSPAVAQDTQAPAPETQDPAAPAVTETKPDPNQVVARVNGADVTRQEVLDSAADLPEQIRSQIDLVFPQLLNRYIGLKLLGDKGRAEDLANDPEVKKLMGEYETQAIRQVYVTRYLNKQVTEEAIKARYDKKLKDNPPPEEVRAAHILVKTEDEAKAIIEQLKGGGDFAAIAKEKSEDKGSGANGGELGWFTKDVMVKEFADAAFAMKPDEFSQTPVKSQFGYHVIKLEERRTQPAPSLDSQREQIRAELSEENVQTLVQNLRKEANVEILGPDGKPVEEQKPAEGQQ